MCEKDSSLFPSICPSSFAPTCGKGSLLSPLSPPKNVIVLRLFAFTGEGHVPALIVSY